MIIQVQMPFTKEELDAAMAAAEQGNAGPLRALCGKELQRFEDKIREHPDYRDGLVQIERFAVEGYLYQKIRGHVDETAPENPSDEERQDGAA